MPSRFTRFGEFFMQGLAQNLSEGTTVHVPHVGSCKVRSVIEPRLHSSNWSMEVDISFPGESHSAMTIGMYTFGSCLMEDTEGIALPEPSYVDESDSLYPTEHQEAWHRLLDSLEEQLGARGHRVGSADDDDIYLIADYMPSDGISASVLKPSILTSELLALCQELVRAESAWQLWIRLAFDFVDERHKGHRESVLVRPDRVVHDYDPDRLRRELGNEIPLLAQ